MMPLLSFSRFLLTLCLWVSIVESSANPEINQGLALTPEPQHANPARLLLRQAPADQPYTCSATVPCTDGSCCDASSNSCGRDAIHCAPNVCVSGCDAKASCGSWAANPGQTCPLNVCCSKFGFCGIGDEFCGDGCQSNCGSPGLVTTSGFDGNVTNTVIGYWEGWCLESRGCNGRTIDDVPVDSLTHLNLAFAYINSAFDVAPMGSDGSGQVVGQDIYNKILGLKARAPGLQIWISIGGWTFSDNGTTTQPIFGEIAGSATNRQTFADNLYKFCRTYGFDGVDLDWEYPGAGDRGGTPADTPNYVLLLETIYNTFASHAGDNVLGLSFTAPTSYWYLQHFQLDQMYQFVNWINLMSYDL
jgi:chitinase